MSCSHKTRFFAVFGGMTLMERSQVAERPDDGSRGLQPTVCENPGCVAERRLTAIRHRDGCSIVAPRGPILRQPRSNENIEEPRNRWAIFGCPGGTKTK